jgi:molecular chaperone DnaJ
MEKPKDYYQLLGVPRDASPRAIKRAFQRLARRPHAGHAPDGLALAELQAAYETLSNADARRRYDETLGEPHHLDRDFSLVRRPAMSDLRRPITPTSLSAEIVVAPEEASRGTVLSIDVPVTATCEACSGTGGRLFDCGRCAGEGQLARRLPVPVHLPPRTREGTVFQVRTDDPAVPSILLTVHLRRAH